MGPTGEQPTIKDIVNKVISGLSKGESKQERISEEGIKKVWSKAAGGRSASKSRPTSLRKGKLIVAVDDSSLLYDLTLRKREIVEVLGKETNGRIQDVRFRIGETRGEEKPKRKKTKPKK